MRVDFWAQRRWWVVPFLAAMLPVAHVASWFGAVNPVLDFVGWTIGRYGMKMGARHGNS